MTDNLMDEMVEAGAKRLAEAHNCPDKYPLFKVRARLVLLTGINCAEEQGWRLVPREASKKAQEKGWDVADDCVDFWDYGGWTGAGYTLEPRVAQECWQAMFDAAPKVGQ